MKFSIVVFETDENHARVRQHAEVIDLSREDLVYCADALFRGTNEDQPGAGAASMLSDELRDAGRGLTPCASPSPTSTLRGRGLRSK